MRLALVLGLVATACAPSSAYRVAAPLPLPSDPPATPCEQRNWVQLVPTYVPETAQTSYAIGSLIKVTEYDRSVTGIGVYRGEEARPLRTDAAMKALGAADLRPATDERLRSIARQRDATTALRAGGLIALAAGLGVFAGAGNDGATPAIGLAGAGLLMECIALFTQPDPFAQSFLDVREQVFIEEETDMARLEISADQANQGARATCK